MKWASGFASPMPPKEREILDDTFFDSDELALLVRAYLRALAEAPELDESGRVTILRKLVDLGEEGVRNEDALVRCAI